MAIVVVPGGERSRIECRGACSMSLYSLSLGGILVGFGSCLLDEGGVVIGVLGCWITDCSTRRGVRIMGIAVGQRSWSGVGIGVGFCVGGVAILHGVLVLFGCLVL
jgi:hypothetical protein